MKVFITGKIRAILKGGYLRKFIYIILNLFTGAFFGIIALGGVFGSQQIEDWLVTLMFSIFTYILIRETVFIIKSIPIIAVLSYDETRELLSRRGFVLILWSTADYNDTIGTDWEKIDRMLYQLYDTGSSEIETDRIVNSLDSQLNTFAKKNGLRLVRFYTEGDTAFDAANGSKGLFIKCADGTDWKKVVSWAIHQSRAIVVFKGRGESFEWELAQLQSSEQFQKKTSFFEGDISNTISQLNEVVTNS